MAAAAVTAVLVTHAHECIQRHRPCHGCITSIEPALESVSRALFALPRELDGGDLADASLSLVPSLHAVAVLSSLCKSIRKSVARIFLTTSLSLYLDGVLIADVGASRPSKFDAPLDDVEEAGAALFVSERASICASSPGCCDTASLEADFLDAVRLFLVRLCGSSIWDEPEAGCISADSHLCSVLSDAAVEMRTLRLAEAAGAVRCRLPQWRKRAEFFRPFLVDRFITLPKLSEGVHPRPYALKLWAIAARTTTFLAPISHSVPRTSQCTSALHISRSLLAQGLH